VKIDLTNLPKLVSPAFQPLLVDQSRYLILWGGAGSSKSWFAAEKQIARALLGRHKFFCCRKTNANVEKSVVAQLQEILDRWGVPYTSKQKPFFTYQLQTPSRSQLICGGLDDQEKVKSVPGITGIWMEEATEFEQADLLQLDLRLRGKTKSYKQIVLSFNPVLKSNWIYGEFFQSQPNAEHVDDHITRFDYRDFRATAHHSTYDDNPFLDAEYRKVLEGLVKSSKLFFTVYKQGQWGSLEGVVYYAFERGQNVSDKIAYDPSLPILWTHDFNIGEGKPMSSLICQRHKDVLHVVDEIVIDSADTNEAVKEFQERYPKAKNTIVYGDAAGRAKDTRSKTTDYQILRDAGFVRQDVPRANPSIRDRHNAANARLCSADGTVSVMIHPRCTTLITGLETVKLKPGASYVEEETREQHVTTALGYLINRIWPVKRFKRSGRKYWK